jgi:hypothetical protein
VQNFPFSHKYQDLAAAGINTTQVRLVTTQFV